MTGDIDDMIARQRAVLPRWFPDQSPVLDGVLAGFGQVATHVYALLQYVRAQTRLQTASDGYLDILGMDLLGLRLRRKPGQTDNAFRAAIAREVLRERNTRRGLQKVVEDLTGFQVRMFEPFNAYDCGGIDTGYLGYDMVGRWGATNMPRQILMATLQPVGSGIPNVSGLDEGHGGFDEPVAMFGDQSQVAGPVTNQDIYDAINGVRAAGVKVWVAIGYPPEAHLDEDFTLGSSELV